MVYISVHQNICDKLGAGDLLHKINRLTNGKGGGKKQFAQGGGPKLDFEKVLVTLIKELSGS